MNILKKIRIIFIFIFICNFSYSATLEGKMENILKNEFTNYLKDLEYITNIDSGTGNLEGSKKIAEFLKEKLTKIGATVELLESKEKGAEGIHVIARVKGNGKKKILFLMHTDTVFKEGEAAKRPFKYDPESGFAYGPGVGDSKACVIQTIYMIKTIKEIGYKDYKELIFYYDAAEETGSDFGDKIITSLAKESDFCIVLDTAHENWGITVERKGKYKYQIEVEGISGHAGNSPQSSANAIVELCNQISKLHTYASELPKNPLEYKDEELAKKGIYNHGQFIPNITINTGIIETTNKSLNVIPDYAMAKFEVRAYKKADLERLHNIIMKIPENPTIGGTKIKVNRFGVVTAPMEKNSEVEKMIAIYKKIVKEKYNKEVIEWSSGGCTDGNVAAEFIPTIDGLSIEVIDEHTVNEKADLNSFIPRTYVLIKFIMELNK